MSTIDEIMGRISRYAVAVCKAKTNREMSMLDDARDSLRDLIAAELAAKDAEIERLKAQIAEPANPVPGEWIEWKGGECPIAGAGLLADDSYSEPETTDLQLGPMTRGERLVKWLLVPLVPLVVCVAVACAVILATN